MTKQTFVEKIAAKADITNKEAANFLTAFEDVLMEDVFSQNEKVTFRFGSLSGVDKSTSERQARSPKTGETILVPARQYHGLPKLSVSKSVKENCQVK